MNRRVFRVIASLTAKSTCSVRDLDVNLFLRCNSTRLELPSYVRSFTAAAAAQRLPNPAQSKSQQEVPKEVPRSRNPKRPGPRPEIPQPFKIDVAKQPVVDAEFLNAAKDKPSEEPPPNFDQGPDFSRVTESPGINFRRARQLILITAGSCLGYVLGQRKFGALEVEEPLPSPSSIAADVKARQEEKKAVDGVGALDTYLPIITDQIFESTDNLCVIWVDSKQQLEDSKDAVLKFIDYVKSLSLPVEVSFMYSIRSTPAERRIDTSDSELGRNALTVVVYKGQRKSHVVVQSEPTEATKELFDIQTNSLREFFKPVSEESLPNYEGSISTEPPTDYDVEPVTYNTFYNRVINASSPQHPIILQLMEDSCFLCFLIRPFINSISKIFKEHNIPVTIKRFNLNRNDFTPECPIVRSTPTFVEYKGPQAQRASAFQLWKEYKPREFIARLVEEYHLSDEVRDQLELLELKMQERFQKFGLLSIWNQELYHLQAFHAGEELPSQGKTEAGSAALDEEYSKIVADLMEKDSRRSDCLEENLEYLGKEISAIEMDCISYARIIGEKLFEIDGRFDFIKARLQYDAEQAEKGGNVEEVKAGEEHSLSDSFTESSLDDQATLDDKL